MTTKHQLYKFCESYAEERIIRIKKSINDIQESLSSETKSSAGDKHETGRAMLQLEREKLGQQLAEGERTKQVLAKVNPDQNSSSIGLGSWVKTSKADYFLAISAGEYKCEASSVYCISSGTPIGKLLIGRAVGDTIHFNGSEIKINSVE